MVDCFSNYLEVARLESKTATISKLKSIVSRQGIRMIVISDNMSFQMLWKVCSGYSPVQEISSQNGMVENTHPDHQECPEEG